MVWSDLIIFKIKHKLGTLKEEGFTKREIEIFKKAFACTPEQSKAGLALFNSTNPENRDQIKIPVLDSDGNVKFEETDLNNPVDVITALNYSMGVKQTVGEAKSRINKSLGIKKTGQLHHLDQPTLPSNITWADELSPYLDFDSTLADLTMGNIVTAEVGSDYEQLQSLKNGREKAISINGTTISITGAKSSTEWYKRESNETSITGNKFANKKEEFLYEHNNYSKAHLLVSRGSSFLHKTLTSEERKEYDKMARIDPSTGEMTDDNHLKGFESELGDLFDIMVQGRGEVLQRAMTTLNFRTRSYGLENHYVSSFIPGTRSRSQFVPLEHNGVELSRTARKMGVLNKMTGAMESKSNIDKIYFDENGDPIDVNYSPEGKPISYRTMDDSTERIISEELPFKANGIKGGTAIEKKEFQEKYGQKTKDLDKLYKENMSEESKDGEPSESDRYKSDRSSLFTESDWKLIAEQELSNKSKHAYFNAVSGSLISTASGQGRTKTGFNLFREQSHHLLPKGIQGRMLGDEVKVSHSLRVHDKDGNLIKSTSSALQDREFYAPNDPKALTFLSEELHQNIVHRSVESTLHFGDAEARENNRKTDDGRTIFIPDHIMVPDSVDANGNIIFWRQQLLPHLMEKFLSNNPDYFNKVEAELEKSKKKDKKKDNKKDKKKDKKKKKGKKK